MVSSRKPLRFTVLCDAKISLLVFSSKSKCHEYISPNTTMKKIYDQYQKTLGIDLWNTHYDKLRRETRQRKGVDLSYLRFDELRRLEQNMADSQTTIWDRKGVVFHLSTVDDYTILHWWQYHVIKTQEETCKRKVRNLEERHGDLLLKYEAKCEDTRLGLTAGHGDHNSAVGFANEARNLYAPRLQAAGHHNLHRGGAF